MAVESYYFSHDYNSRNDRKMVALLRKHGVAGFGIYWSVLEMLYEEGGYLMLSECERIAFELRVKKDMVEKVVSNFDLFTNDGTRFWSDSALRRLGHRMAKSEKARSAAQKRWKHDADALQTQSDGNARKGKETKGKESEIETPADFRVYGVVSERSPLITCRWKYATDPTPCRIYGVGGMEIFLQEYSGKVIAAEHLDKFMRQKDGSIFEDGASFVVNSIKSFVKEQFK